MTTTVPPDWTRAIADWSAGAALRGAPATTLLTRSQHLRHTARTLGVSDPWMVEADALLEWFAAQTSWAQETRRCRRSTLRVFYRWGVDGGLVRASPALALPVVKPGAPRPRPAPDRVYRQALAAAGVRERLMIRLGAEIGLRRAEVAQIHSRDLVEDLDGWSLVVHGKGGRERVLPLPPGLAAELRGLPPGYAFPGQDGGHLSPRWVGRLVADLMPDHWTMHTLRHRFATRAWEASSADLFVVQELLGHASPVTTRAYTHITHAKLRATVNAVA